MLCVSYHLSFVENKLTPELQKKRKYRNKWFRAYTLARNPTIVIEMMHKRIKDYERNGRMTKAVSIGSILVMCIYQCTVY